MNTKAIAVAAVLAVAFAALVVCLPQADDADVEGTTYTSALTEDIVPTAYAEADIASSGGTVRAILYYDLKNKTNSLMIDLNDVTIKNQKQNLYKVTLAPGASSAPAVLENIAAVNGQIYLDVSGTDNTSGTAIDLITANQKLDIKVESQDGTTWAGATVSMTPTTPAAAIALTLYDGSMTSTVAKKFGTQAEVNTLGQKYVGTATKIDDQYIQARFASMTLNADLDTDQLVDVNGLFTLIGWTVDSAKTDATEVDLDLQAHTVEEIIYAYADACGNATTESIKKTGSSLGTVEGLTFYGCYEKGSFLIKLLQEDSTDTTNVGKYVEAEKTAVGVAVLSDGATSGTAFATATVEKEVAADGYALLRIQQSSAGKDSYTYAFAHAPAKSSTEWDTPVSLNLGANTGYCTIEMLANGIYKISNVEQALNIKIIATKTTSPQTASYNLAVDYVKNTSAQGQAAVSLDLFDGKAGGKLKVDGTYYRVDTDSIRVYGQLSTINSKLYADPAKAAGSASATTDLVASNVKIGQTSEGDRTSSGADFSGFMDLSAGTGSQFDLVITLGEVDSVKYFFYAAQGVWAPSGSFGSGDVKTPWALAETSS